MSAKKSSPRQAAPPSKKKASRTTATAESKTEDAVDVAPGRQTGSESFPVVGIGASAGGLEALEELLGSMPAETGMAFVVVTHQHPGHTSLLPELLGKCTRMPVAQARDGVRLERNHVYVAPPGGHVAVTGATLHLMEGPEGEMPPLPIDFFFRSLALDRKEHAICIVLSGTGSDGTVGLRAVKGEAGMAMVQEVRSARYAGMPSSAIATALADYVMQPAAMPAQLVAYAQTMTLHGTHPAETAEGPPRLEHPMQMVLTVLRARTGHDFSAYKPTTMRRRVERRMTVHEMTSPEHYARLLRENPHEIDILFRELLIGVTSFFRDPKAFETLAEEALCELVNARPDEYTFRAWVPGCGSGEEAYTIAILLRECAQKAGKMFSFQVFGTDLDAEAIEAARNGHYSAGIAADVPPEILQRHFIQEDATYRVRKEIREMIVFAPQNVIQDPPFTRIDLLCCRNLLIYLNADLQRRLLPIFHYAIKPEGLLMLGPSETIGGFNHLFTTISKKWKVFQRKETAAAYALPAIPAQAVREGADRVATATFAPPTKPVHISTQLEKLLLGRFAPPAVVVNERGDIIYIHGRTGAYLEPPTGQPSVNIHEMAREGLQIELTAALRRALSQDREVVRQHVHVKSNGDYVHVDLSVVKITEPEAVRGLFLVTFRPSPQAPAEAVPEKAGGETVARASGGRVQDLERELRYTKESLQITVEELETANEEMQSLNEELTTVNAELQAKVEDLSRVNDDMQNLLNSTGIATVFLDNDLNIKRYTEQAKRLIKLIPTDIGRPVADLVSELNYDRLADDAREVLETLARKEQEVEGTGGTMFLMRLTPYRTADNVIEGVVITFVDVTETKEAEAAAGRRARELLQGAFDTVQDPALVLDEGLRVILANRPFYQVFAIDRDQAVGTLIHDVGAGEWNHPKLRELLEDIIPRKTAISGFEVAGKFPRIGERAFRLNARRLEREVGQPGMILLTMEDLSD